MENDEILINRLFSGSYLDEGANIGHEVINFFKDDNGYNYLYITPSGRIDVKFHPVKSVLFVRYYDDKTTVEVLAKAEELITADKVGISPKDIKYDGTSIDQIFSNNTHHGKADPSASYTFKTRKIRMPKNGKRIILTVDDEFTLNDNSAQLIRLHSNRKVINNQEGRLYYSQKTDPEAYGELRQLLEDEGYWESGNTTQELLADGSARKASPTLLEIIRKDNDELAFSNLLVHYFQYNGLVFQKFVGDVLGIADFTLPFQVEREYKHIDLLITNKKYIIVVENKIKSGINGVGDDGKSQLTTYQKKVREWISDPKKEFYEKEDCYFIFTPDYNHIDASKYNLEKSYKIINYSTIYDFFCKNAMDFIDEKYFPDFLKNLRNHAFTSMSERNFSIMRSRFLEKINQR